LQKVEENGAYFREKLAAIPGVENVRGLGLMNGADVSPSLGKTAGDVANACLAEGLLILTAHGALRFLPPLVITKEEIGEGLEKLKAALQKQ